MLSATKSIALRVTSAPRVSSQSALMDSTRTRSARVNVSVAQLAISADGRLVPAALYSRSIVAITPTAKARLITQSLALLDTTLKRSMLLQQPLVSSAQLAASVTARQSELPMQISARLKSPNALRATSVPLAQSMMLPRKTAPLVTIALKVLPSEFLAHPASTAMVQTCQSGLLLSHVPLVMSATVQPLLRLPLTVPQVKSAQLAITAFQEFNMKHPVQLAI